MNILVTAGNTQAPIDQVRCITNIFTGRTGAHLALHAWQRGHRVTLLTSHPEVVPDLSRSLSDFPDNRWSVRTYRTFDELHRLLESEVRSEPDALFHAAAVSDYLTAGVFAPAEGTTLVRNVWTGSPPRLVDRTADKLKSDEPELWLRLTRAPKLVDQVRGPWRFRGYLVKFKLEVGKSESDLEAIAERSRRQSAADLVVANTLEGAADWALIGPIADRYERIARAELSRRLIDLVEERA